MAQTDCKSYCKRTESHKNSNGTDSARQALPSCTIVQIYLSPNFQRLEGLHSKDKRLYVQKCALINQVCFFPDPDNASWSKLVQQLHCSPKIRTKMIRLVVLSTIFAKVPPSLSVGVSRMLCSIPNANYAAKKVLISGAAGALGRTMVDKFSREGFEVIGTRSPASFSENSNNDDSAASLKLKWYGVDVTSPDSVRLFAQAVGPIDVLVHCAGGFRFAKSEELLDRDIDFLMDTNLKSAMYLVREFVPLMKQRNFGRVIFISSKATLQPGPGFPCSSIQST